MWNHHGISYCNNSVYFTYFIYCVCVWLILYYAVILTNLRVHWMRACSCQLFAVDWVISQSVVCVCMQRIGWNSDEGTFSTLHFFLSVRSSCGKLLFSLHQCNMIHVWTTARNFLVNLSAVCLSEQCEIGIISCLRFWFSVK